MHYLVYIRYLWFTHKLLIVEYYQHWTTACLRHCDVQIHIINIISLCSSSNDGGPRGSYCHATHPTYPIHPLYPAHLLYLSQPTLPNAPTPTHTMQSTRPKPTHPTISRYSYFHTTVTVYLLLVFPPCLVSSNSTKQDKNWPRLCHLHLLC